MNNLKIEWEWEPASAIRAPELRATFARLRVNVGDDCLTLVEDRESGSSRRSIAVSLYPLAEWIAYNWWFLRAQSRHSADPRLANSSFSGSGLDVKNYQRHNIRNAGDGFLWPNLFILPEGRKTSLIWRADRYSSERWPVRFLSAGQAFVDSGDLQQVLANFVQAVLDRLTDCDVGITPLHEEWNAVQSADSDEVEYLLASARLGLDPFSEAAEYEDAILEVAGSLSGDLLREFFNVASPSRISDDLQWVLAAQSAIEKITGPQVALEETVINEIATVAPVATDSPWRAGYSTARAVRERLGIDPKDSFNIEDYISETVLKSPDRSMQAFGKSSHAGPALVLGANLGLHSRRFTMARAAWNLLRRPNDPFLVTTGHTFRQKAERAFAAELLVPAEGLDEYLGGDIASITEDDIEHAGEHFKVSPLVVKHQIDNQLALA